MIPAVVERLGPGAVPYPHFMRSIPRNYVGACKACGRGHKLAEAATVAAFRYPTRPPVLFGTLATDLDVLRDRFGQEAIAQNGSVAFPCPCGKWARLRAVLWTRLAVPTKCGARCRNARGNVCDCQCKGARHGDNYAPEQAIERKAEEEAYEAGRSKA